MKRSFPVLSVILAMGCLAGCGHSFLVPKLAPERAAALDTTAAADAPPACEVWLELRHDNALQSDPICIKRQNETFAIPSPVYLQGEEGGIDTQFNGMCAESRALKPEETPATKDKPKEPPQQCLWSGLFRSNYPLTFVIRTQDKQKLSRYAHIVRVFRNGKLVFAWKDDSSIAELIIPGDALTARLMPFGAPIDLRIIPAGSPDDPSVTTQVAAKVDPLASRLAVVKGVLLGPQGPAANLIPEVKCLTWLASKAEATALEVLGKPFTPPGDPPDGCPAPDADATKLRNDVKAAIVNAAKTANQSIDDEIKQLGAKYGVAIAAAAEKAKTSLMKKGVDTVLPNNLTVGGTVTQIDALAAQSAQIFDTLNESVRDLLGDLKKLASDRDEQARQLAAITDALEKEGSVFDPFTKNPDLVQGEVALDMHYGDKFQFFLLAPWHGVPIRVTRNVGASLGIENAVPILDVGGFRYQWGTGRSQSFRLGGGIMYFKDENSEVPLTGAKSGAVYHFATEASVNWAGFMVGGGYVWFDNDEFNGKADRNRIRLIVGVDLLKLFGNKNAEAL